MGGIGEYQWVVSIRLAIASLDSCQNCFTSFVGTDIVFKDGRYLVVYDDTKLNQIA